MGSEEVVHRDGFNRNSERVKNRTRDKRKQYKKKIHKVQSDVKEEYDEFDPREVVLEYNSRH